MNAKRLLPLLVCLALAGAATIYRAPLLAWGNATYASVTGRPQPGAANSAQTGPAQLVASGTIEAHTVDVSSPAGGRLAAVQVAEGDRVAPGDLVATLDTSLNDAQISQAQTAVAQGAAQLAVLKAGARPADVDVARAGVAQAKAASADAATAAQDAAALVTAPSSLDVKIATAEAALQAAQEQLKTAQANAAAADLENDLWGRTVKMLQEGFDVTINKLPTKPTIHVDAPSDKMSQALLQWNEASQRDWQAHAQAGIAAAAVETARQNLADLRSQKSDPQALQVQANAAAAAVPVAEAAVASAQANVDVVQSGATPEQIQSAEALVSQAQAGVNTWRVKNDQARVRAPTLPEAGKQPWTVSAVIQRTGEVAAPGSPIVRLANLSQVELSVYVPEPELSRVRLGQPVQVSVDSFPGRLFPGAVSQIADQAEFTPKNVQTRQERANTVYAVKIALPNPDGALKPGMPADATFEDGTPAPGPNAQVPGIGQGVLGRLLPTGAQPGSSGSGPVRASGNVEGTDTKIGAELGGRVVEVAVAEGDTVAAGQALVRLDSSELEAQRAQAAAALEAARADLARVQAAPQASRVSQAQAQVRQAEAALAAARAGLADAKKLRANPQDLDSQINAAKMQVQSATAQIDLAKANVKAAQVLQESLPEGTGSDQDRTKRQIYDQQVLAAQAGQRAVEAQLRGAQAALARLQTLRARPVALDAAVHKAEGQVAQAEAALSVARAALAQVQAPAQAEAVALARARVGQAEAAIHLFDTTLDRLKLASPVTGTVTSQMIHTGEVAQPGAALLTVTDLSRVKLAVYVPAGRIGQVQVGQQAQVTVDAYPGRQFSGTVTHINDQAEFTPKNVQTQEERVKTVFRVEITLDNPEGALKPGMPADAVFQ